MFVKWDTWEHVDPSDNELKWFLVSTPLDLS